MQSWANGLVFHYLVRFNDHYLVLVTAGPVRLAEDEPFTEEWIDLTTRIDKVVQNARDLILAT